MATTVGQILVNDCLPPEFRDYTRVMDSNGLEDLLQRIAKESPEKYSEITKKLMDTGNDAAFDNGVTLRLSDCETKFDKAPYLKIVADAEKSIENDSSLSESEKNNALGEVYGNVQSSIEKGVYDTELKARNQLALQVASKARGSKNQLMSFISTPGSFPDSNGNTVPMFIQHSFAEGLTPAEYWAGSFGTRTSTVQCLTPDTEVLMADWSVKQIGLIRPGDMVMGSTKEGKTYPTKVVRFYDNGIQPVYDFKFRRFGSKKEFLSVKATENHKMLGTKAVQRKNPRSKWFPSPDLIPLSKATVFKSRNSDFRLSLARGCLSSCLWQQENHPEALLLGLLTGDGCVTHTSFTFSCADKTLVEDITPYLASLGLRLHHTKSKGYTWQFQDIQHSNHGKYLAISSFSGREHRFANKNRVIVWEELGDRYSYDKVLPSTIWKWDDESIIAYISGIIATDGCVYSRDLGFSGKYKRTKNVEGFSLEMTAEPVVSGVMQLLRRRFGIYGGVVTRSWREDKGRPTYSFRINHPEMMAKFKDIFKDIPGVRRTKLLNINPIASYNTPRVECSTYSKTFIGNLPTVDIEVESDDHMFVLANGLISSNSKIATAKGGAFGKLLSQSANNQVVVTEDCGGVNGVPMPLDDDDNLGAVLAQKTGKYGAGTVITKSVLSDLRKDKKLDEIVIRSPMTCGCKDGVCSKCAGIRETGDFPPIGYNLGTNAASAFAERITQGALNCLAEGTLVRMADGSAKPIDQVNPGDYVLGVDFNGNLTPTEVVNRYDQGDQPCIKTVFRNDSGEDIYLESTVKHPVLASVEWDNGGACGIGKFRVGIDADEFTAIISIPADSGYEKDGYRRVDQEDIGVRRCYDLEVAHRDHLFNLANGINVGNTKHQGRLASGEGQYQGFAMFTSMAKVPKSYPDKATLASIDGEVTAIKDAPQGGKYIMMSNGSGEKEHYVPTGYNIMVKPGDKLEAGDQLSDGVINPAELVEYKGIGEARKYWAQRFTKGIRDSGMKGNRRNAEVLAKTLINNVELEEEDPAGLPGDITTYNKWAYTFKPRPDTKVVKPSAAVGQYLEQPVLHYTIGTRITPSVAKTLSKFGQDKIFANPNKPNVTPFMQRVEDSNAVRDDWMARLGTTYLKDRLIEDTQRGAISRLHSTEPNPGLAKGVEFGTWGQPGSKNKSEAFTY